MPRAAAQLTVSRQQLRKTKDSFQNQGYLAGRQWRHFPPAAKVYVMYAAVNRHWPAERPQERLVVYAIQTLLMNS